MYKSLVYMWPAAHFARFRFLFFSFFVFLDSGIVYLGVVKDALFDETSIIRFCIIYLCSFCLCDARTDIKAVW